ncbi:glycosyltransferase family 39 protein [Glacieibacterium megasporae]|uniref:glycosyltransferase family 39 protein n=1 Tax=Glacieibacterium megasporae TaxID=2835787 RepID=UPI001C1E1FC6|nr:glycosyltransferase family 39 protein [Polymorphobacter megasporae]UAJ08994.1 glycosyltransferase family 39 protein [Polymorphobacter megasporae]
MGKIPGPEYFLSAALAAAVAVGLAGAFIGLNVSSLWADELFTFWVVGDDHSAAAALARAQSDIHPPLYYMSAFLVTEIFGRSPVVLRAFSAILGVTAIPLFYYVTRKTYSIPARLVAMTIAVSSWFWVNQTQNARSYGLCLLIATAVYGAALALVARERDGRPVGWTLAALVLSMALGSCVHPYMLFVALATLASLFVLCARLRWVFVLIGGSITAAWFAYIHFVIRAHTVFSLEHSWIGNTTGWYRDELRTSWQASLSNKPMIAIVLVCVASAAAVIMRDRSRRQPVTIDGRYLCLLVVPLVVIAGISSSMILTPNFTSRNLLVCSPFIWGAEAFLFDLGVARLGTVGRIAASIVVAVLALVSIGGVRARSVPVRTPFRESARWIDSQPGCRGQAIAYVITDGVYNSPVDAERHGAFEYGYYLQDVGLVPLYLKDAIAGRAVLNPSCRVVAWGAHYLNDSHTAEAVRAGLVKSLHRKIVLLTLSLPGRKDGGGAAYIFLTP